MEKVAIIAIGDELLIGQVVNTNAAYLSQLMNAAGYEVLYEKTIHDDAQAITQALHEALSQCSIVLMTGGLGPTKDDITKQTLCNYFHDQLIDNEKVKAHIFDLYKDRPAVLNRLTESQWLVPSHATIIENKVGSAPIMVFEGKTKPLDYETQKLRNSGTFLVVSMPGVPYEMEQAMPDVLSLMNKHFQQENIIHKTLLLHGIPESALALKIASWETALPPHLHLAYLPKSGFIRLRLSAYGKTDNIEQEFAKLQDLVREYLVLNEDVPLEVAIGKILKDRHLTVSTAESCTGGRVAAKLNQWSGSSAFYMGSVVAYDNRIKHEILGVSNDDLVQYGAVSEQAVRQMAEGVRRLLSTDYAIATSGIAGPTGGTPTKPVGTIWIAVSSAEHTISRLLHLSSLPLDRIREQNILRTVEEALLLLLSCLEKDLA